MNKCFVGTVQKEFLLHSSHSSVYGLLLAFALTCALYALKYLQYSFYKFRYTGTTIFGQIAGIIHL